MVWDYEESAIYINLESEGLLNFYNNEPHTMILGVIQLSEPKGFTKLLKSPEVIKQILETGKAEETILQLDRFVVTPGTRTSLLIDRAQDAKVVGVVAGYFNFDAIKSSRLFKIPPIIKEDGVFSTTYKATPGILGLHFVLGSHQFIDVKILDYDAELGKIVEKESLDDARDSEVVITVEDLKREYKDFKPTMKLSD